MWLVLFVWTNRRQIVEFVCVFGGVFALCTYLSVGADEWEGDWSMGACQTLSAPVNNAITAPINLALPLSFYPTLLDTDILIA